MLHRIGIASLVLLCACSIEDAAPDPGGTAPDPGVPSEPASPDADTLPSTARLIPEPVDSVEQLPGRYAHPFALPGQVSVISLATPNLATGSYELYRSCGVPVCIKEAGQYHVVPTNPAIGFAALSLIDQTGTVRVTYILDLLWRDADGELVAVQLRPLFENTTGPTQVWWRLPDADEDEPIERVAQVPVREDARQVLAAPAPGDDPEVAGVFVRALPVYGDIGAITLDADGAYSASYPYCLPWCIPETGAYQLDLANDVTGTGHLSLIPSADATRTHDYAVYAIWRAPDGVAAAIQLQRVDGVVPSGPPFTLYRQWWSGTANAAPVESSGCTYWLGLATYYRIRALQCGMGACWPLSGWYSAWAQYYQGLADTAGCTAEP